MYEQISQGINGTTRTSYLPAPETYTPTLLGSTGAGAFTYTSQNAYVQRIGNTVDLWYEISWNAQTGATGNMQMILPYDAILFTGSPFVGTAFAGAINLGAFSGTYIAPVSQSFNAQFWKYPVAGANKTELAVSSAGNIQGFLRYITQDLGGD